MRIALIGASGQLGSDLQSRLADDVIPLSHTDIEITDVTCVRRQLDRVAPDMVLNAAAYNFVDRAEDEPAAAYAVNALGPRNLSLFCCERGIPVLHVSSDFVFGLDAGRSIPYREDDFPGPISAYGVSKLAGEYYVRSLCRQHFVVRTCGLYGRTGTQEGGKGNFVETMLRLGKEGRELKVVDDQRCTPTSATDLATAIVTLIRTDAYGLYHATSTGDVTWYQFAKELFRLARLDVSIAAITSQEFGAQARRPAYSVLDTHKLTDTIGVTLPHWQEALAQYVAARPAD